MVKIRFKMVIKKNAFNLKQMNHLITCIHRKFTIYFNNVACNYNRICQEKNPVISTKFIKKNQPNKQLKAINCCYNANSMITQHRRD